MEFEITEQEIDLVGGTGVELAVIMKRPGAPILEAEHIYGVYAYNKTTSEVVVDHIRAGAVDNILKLVNILFDEGYIQILPGITI